MNKALILVAMFTVPTWYPVFHPALHIAFYSPQINLIKAFE